MRAWNAVHWLGDPLMLPRSIAQVQGNRLVPRNPQEIVETIKQSFHQQFDGAALP
jgi:hypothetical protein